MTAKESFIYELKFRSACEYGVRLAAVPGLRVVVDKSDLVVKVEVEDARAFGKYIGHLTSGGPGELSAIAAGSSLDVNHFEKIYRTVSRRLIQHLPGYEIHKQFIPEIPLIVLADYRLNAEARSEGIVALYAGLLHRADLFLDLVMVILSLRGLPSFYSDRENLYRRILRALRSILGPEGNAIIMDEFVELKRELMSLRFVIPYETFTNGLWLRFISFVIAHEYGHILLDHFSDSSRFSGSDADPRISRRLCEEVEADLYAAEAVKRMLEAAYSDLGTKSTGPQATGWQVAVAFYCMVLACEEKPRRPAFLDATSPTFDLLDHMNTSGYPDSFGRMSVILSHFYKGMHVLENGSPFLQPFLDLAQFHDYVASNS